MTDPNPPQPAVTGDAAPGGPSRPDPSRAAPPRDPTAKREEGTPRSGSARSDPDGLDQSVGRGDAGDPLTRDGAI